MKWYNEIEKILSGQGSLRVIDTPVLLKIVQGIRPGVSLNTLHGLINDMEAAGKLIKIRRGLYANTQARPQVAPPEAAQYLFHGAVVSLQYVLGAFGVINNPPRAITAVVPIETGDARLPPSVRTIVGDFGEYRIHVLPASFFGSSAGVNEDVEDPAARFYRRATPEKALVDWIYLARSPRSKLTMPPFDTDLEGLDAGRLIRLARNVGIEKHMGEFIERLGNSGEGQLPGILGPGV